MQIELKEYITLSSKNRSIYVKENDEISTKDLRRMFYHYDTYFFDGFFRSEYHAKIFFRLSKRMTKSGGKTEAYNGIYMVSLSSYLLFQSFADVERKVVVNGIRCKNRLEATMRLLEHQIIHLLELIVYGNTSCAKDRFKRLSKNIFGHTDVTHQLVTQEERAKKKFGLTVGDEVVFEYKGETHKGVIKRITKRATVMVPNPKGAYKDKEGKRYAKYYIPLKDLRPAR